MLLKITQIFYVLNKGPLYKFFYAISLNKYSPYYFSYEIKVIQLMINIIIK